MDPFISTERIKDRNLADKVDHRFLLITLHGYVVIEKLQYFNNEILRKTLSQMCITHIHTLTEGLRPFFHLLGKKAFV